MYIVSLSAKKIIKVLFVLLFICTVILSALFINSQKLNQEIKAAAILGSNNEERIAFLKSCGVEVQNEPLESSQIEIPKKFDNVLEKYSKIQSKGGFRLSKLKGKEVTMWIYQVNNIKDENNPDCAVLAHLMVYKGNIVGGDICSAAINGFINPLIVKKL